MTTTGDATAFRTMYTVYGVYVAEGDRLGASRVLPGQMKMYQPRASHRARGSAHRVQRVHRVHPCCATVAGTWLTASIGRKR